MGQGRGGALALPLPGLAVNPWRVQEGKCCDAVGSSGWEQLHLRGREVTITALWDSRSRDKPCANSSGIPCLFSTGKASPQASRIPKLLKRCSRHEAAAGNERVDHLPNSLRLI